MYHAISKVGTRALALVLALALGASGCGFRPLYGTASVDGRGHAVETHLAAIEIEPIANRLGQQVHNYLRDGMNPQGQPGSAAYFLDVRVAESSPGGLARRDLGASRTNIELEATFWLRDGADKVLLADTARAVTGFDVFRDPLNDISALEDAEDRTAQLLARMITSRVAAYFAQTGAP